MPIGTNNETFFETEADELAFMDDTLDVYSGKTVENGKFVYVGAKDVTNDGIENIYFDYDGQNLSNEHKRAIADDAAVIKKKIREGKSKTVLVDGHACHSAGTNEYNRSISETRAKKVADCLVSYGIKPSIVKVTGRGKEFPAKDSKGNPITGNRDQQWANRRVEIRVI